MLRLALSIAVRQKGGRHFAKGNVYLVVHSLVTLVPGRRIDTNWAAIPSCNLKLFPEDELNSQPVTG
jgi:hypothetical protein